MHVANPSMLEVAINKANKTGEGYTLIIDVIDPHGSEKIEGAVLSYGPGWVELEVVNNAFQSGRTLLKEKQKEVRYFNEDYIKHVEVAY